MKEVEDETVHLIVTSPPYWNIKDYGNPRQIGYNDTLNEYIKKLGKVWDECVRVLHKGCRLCINVGDVYLRARGGAPYQIIPIHAYIVNDIMRRHRKNVVYLGSIIWNKIPTSNPSGGATVMGSYGYPRNGYLSLNYEYIAIFKKLGKDPKVTKDVKEKSRIELKEWRELFTGIWRFNGARQMEGIAIFPEELPRRLIRMFTFKEDTVLDPFLGSGTVTKVAYMMGRNSIGYEIGFKTPNGEDWRELIKKKIGYYDTPLAIRDKIFFFKSR
jgi:site-specific DNA-methyltransferase (adenine-specific)